MNTNEVTVELFGIPRQRAGLAEITLRSATVGDVLGALEAACPALGALVAEGKLAPHYLLSINGERFVGDLDAPAPRRLLLLSADAGG